MVMKTFLFLFLILFSNLGYAQTKKNIFVGPTIQFNQNPWQGYERIIPFIGFKSGFEFEFKPNHKLHLPISAVLSNHNNFDLFNMRQTNIIISLNPEYRYKPFFLQNWFLSAGLNYQFLISYNYYPTTSPWYNEKFLEDYLYGTIGLSYYWSNKKEKKRSLDFKFGFSDGWSEYDFYLASSYIFYLN